MGKFENIINSGFSFNDEEYQLKTIYVLFNSMLTIIVMTLCVMGVFRILTSYYTQGIIDFGTSFITLVYLYALRRAGKGNYIFIAYMMTATSLFVIVFSYYNSGGVLNINAWFTALTIPIFFVLGYRVAMYLALLFMIIIAVLSASLHYADTLNILYGYVPLFLSVLFLHIYELRFQKFATLLKAANTNLEKKVKEKTLERTKVLEKQKKELHYQAHYDYLTKLPNRVDFQKKVRQIVTKSDQNHRSVAALFIDLDNFKNINDSFGHDIGDNVIKLTSTRIRNCIRDDDYLARLGGDEFVVLVEDFNNRHDLESIASNIIGCVSKLIEIEKQTMFVACSIGISLYPDDTLCYRDFVKYADTAMYKAKERGRNNHQFYSADMTEVALEKVLMETSMRMALKNEEFVVYYQPQVDALTEEIIGLEALVRWEHKEMGIISPGKFIPLAEETGLIKELGDMVMKEGMTQIKKWHDDGYDIGRLALNISAKQLRDDDFVDSVKLLLQETKCKAEYIELEVTESSIMYDVSEAIEKLNKIRDLGIHVSVDDFGTGYSSLAYLKKLPVNKLKIDQSFIMDIPDNKEDAAITNAIIAVAKSLGLDVIAEGVETMEQKDYLVQHDCKNIQGYLYYRPMPAERLDPVLKECQATPSHSSV